MKASVRLLIFTVSLFGAVATLADTPQEVARTYVVRAYEGAFDSLQKTPAADTALFERKVRNMLRVRCLSPALTVEGVAFRDSSASVDLRVVLHKTERTGLGHWSATDDFPLRVELTQQAGTWLVSGVAFPERELADAIFNAPDAERPRLLQASHQRLSAGVVRALYERAIGLLNGGKFKEAEAVAKLTRDLAIAAGDAGGEALALGAEMFVVESRDRAQGGRLSVEALRIAEAAGDPDVLARTWYNRGRWLGSQDSAAADAQAHAYRTAAAFAERAEDPTIYIRVVYSMANRAATEHEHLTALTYVDRILPLARELGDTAGELAAESVLATIYLQQGDRARGLFHHNRALELSSKNSSFAYTNLLLRSGWLLVEESRFDEAQAIFSRLLSRDRDGNITTVIPISEAHLASTLVSLARIEAATGNLSEAECVIREASRLRKMEPGGLAGVVARGHLRRQQHREALRLALAALSEPRLVVDHILDALGTAARAYRGLDLQEQAMSLALEAIDLRESLNARVAGDEQQRATASNATSAYYELAAELALARGDSFAALAFLERGRAFVLTEILEHGRSGLGEIEQREVEEQARRERNLVRLRMELERVESTGAADARIVREQLDAERAAHASFLDRLRARSQRRQAARSGNDPESVAKAIRHLPERTVAIEYLVADGALHIFVAGVRSNGERLVRVSVPIERAELRRSVDDFVTAVTERRVTVRESARRLYDLLVRPVESELKDVDSIVFVPHDVLWRVPFAALVDPRGRYLLESAVLTYAPSVTAYALMTGSRRGPAFDSLFAVGNPLVGEADRKSFAALYRDAKLGPLPDAEREVREVGQLYARAVVLSGAEATESRTKSAAKKASVIHFATHALFDDAHPMSSRLALARDEAGADDGWLEAREIMNLDVDADLVVLSACETARGAIGGGEGVVGMAWSFFVAGARSTISTQWKVGTDSTAILMIDFHRTLHRSAATVPLRKARSLRDAQLRVLRDPRYRHPFHWAAFVILGDAS